MILAIAIVVLVLLAVAVLPPWTGTPEQDERMSRIDRELDERENLRRCIGGWRL